MSFENAVIGATASSLANIAVYPLDLAKTLVQTQLKDEFVEEAAEETEEERAGSRRQNRIKPIALRSGPDEAQVEPYKGALDALERIYREEGVAGLYRGLGSSTVAGFIQSFSYFFWYTLVRKHYFRLKQARGADARFSTAEELVLGIVAAATSQLFVNPINVVATRQQTRGQAAGAADMRTVAREVYEENGWRGFWAGLKVSLVLTVNPSITYATYERLREALFPTPASSTHLVDSAALLSPGQNFVLGVLSKIVSTVITQPLIIAKASLQRTGSCFQDFHQVLQHLYSTEGPLSLWKGLGPQITKGVIVQGLLFMFKGELTKMLRKFMFYLVLLRSSRRALKG
ncbi:AaceriADR036Cp [[Ashbya] aceris (nom. inval.)]|nr:AaceriADR036Cp [[Ashbya] aceris (nom. inval.)]